ncbi:TetR/AcrR family transcriptional regulator [Bergeyella sp. RCAD1439]|uniref:TetR/AcrR family transcriptional regulator n=1 Tax=Bergeyella anatis TaxID=3113737 RepID=UPI002E194CB3|nr:TetR/AcrR family transcriptional regulator [Bergeyella sp. RCAD1439]
MEAEFLQEVTRLFLENGAKTVTMDDVAKKFGMSKKTLYAKYKNKEALIEDVLACKLDGIAENLKRLNVDSDNAIERLLCRDEQMDEMVKSNDTIMVRQLLKYYPHIFNKHMKLFSEKISEIFVRNVERGRLQGLYREDFSAESYVHLMLLMMQAYDNSPIVDSDLISRDAFRDRVIDFYLQAIMTEKGREEYQQIKK